MNLNNLQTNKNEVDDNTNKDRRQALKKLGRYGLYSASHDRFADVPESICSIATNTTINADRQ